MINDLFNGLATLFTGVIAFLIYYLNRRNRKQDAAKAILQEIRRAENIIKNYKDYKQYKFKKKIIATNSWNDNLHLFVRDLSADSIDKISDLYSAGEYLDSVVDKVSNFSFDQGTKSLERLKKQFEDQAKPASLTQEAQINMPGQNIPPGIVGGQKVLVDVQIKAPWKDLLDEISLNYEPIYNSSICQKLKDIAKIKD